MEVINQLIGRLHPVVVHLPIGFIISALFLQWFTRKTKNAEKLVAFLFLWGGIFGTVACISGYLLYLGEGYSFDNIKFHLWSGIITALFSFFLYLLHSGIVKKLSLKRIPSAVLAFLIFLLVSLTGHLGGSITHGKDYFTEPLPQSMKQMLGLEMETAMMPILTEDDWEKAILYEDLVQPILNTKCVSCHNPKKSKGELLLNDKVGILKGGESGSIIDRNNPEGSPLYSRLILPMDDEDHMPPKDKTQLTKEEIEIIKIWINNENSFSKNIREIGMDKNALSSFFSSNEEAFYPKVEVRAVAADTLINIRKKGIHVEVIGDNSNFLRVSCINKPDFKDSDFTLLNGIQQQIVSLDLGGTQITDAIFTNLKKLQNLTSLKIDNTSIRGENIHQIKDLPNLKVINLTSTGFESAYMPNFSSFKQLKTVYLFDSNVNSSEVSQEQTKSQVTFDFGSYQLPIIPSDSIQY